MQRLTLHKRASGVHAVHDAEGNALGVVNIPGDLDLDDEELSSLMQKHAEKRAAQGAARDFIAKVQEHMKKTGTSYGQALSEVSRQDPDLAARYRSEVLGTHLL